MAFDHLTPFDDGKPLIRQLIKNGKPKSWLFFLCGIPMSTVWNLDLWNFDLTDIVMALLLLSWFFSAKGRSREASVLRKFNPVVSAFIVFTVWAVMSIIINHLDIREGSFQLLLLRTVKFFLYALVFGIMCKEWQSGSRSPTYLFWGFMLGAALQGAFIIAQPVVEEEYDQEMNTNYSQGGYVRQDSLGKANATGTVLAAAIVYILPFLMKKKSLTLGLLAGGMAFALFAGLSRGAWASLLFGLILLFGGTPRRIGILLVLLGILIVGANSEVVQKRLFTAQRLDKQGNTTYDGARTHMAWLVLSQRVPQSPIWGRGFYGRFGNSKVWSTGSHNLYVQILWETGVIGLTLFLVFITRFWKAIKRTRSSEDRKHIYAIFATIMFSNLSGEFAQYPPVLACYIMLLLYPLLVVREQERSLGRERKMKMKLPVDSSSVVAPVPCRVVLNGR